MTSSRKGLLDCIDIGISIGIGKDIYLEQKGMGSAWHKYVDYRIDLAGVLILSWTREKYTPTIFTKEREGMRWFERSIR